MNCTCKTLVLSFALATLAVAGSACSKDRGDQSAGAAATLETPEKAAPIDARSQYDLVADIADAEKLDSDDAEVRYEEIRQDYQGKRFRWKVHRITALCPGVERCNVLPFDAGGKDHRRIVQGWMPRLQLTPETSAALDARCTGEQRCTFEFEGTLSKFVLSTEHLTSLQFDDIRVL